MLPSNVLYSIIITSNVADPGWVNKNNQDPYPGSGMNIPDHNSESLETVFWLSKLKFFDADPVPGSGIFLTRDPGSGMKICGIRDKHPGSATLITTAVRGLGAGE